MRHNKKFNHLGRTHSHRQAMLSNMSASLIMHKRIFTTVAKAKALRQYVEPMITKATQSVLANEDTTHSRRLVFQKLQDKAAVTELFVNVSQKIGERPGGYTRIIKTGNRLGDNASMCFIELVDYNENMVKEDKKVAKKTTRRSRKAGATTDAGTKESATETANVASKKEAKAEKVETVEAATKEPKPSEKADTKVETDEQKSEDKPKD